MVCVGPHTNTSSMDLGTCKWCPILDANLNDMEALRSTLKTLAGRDLTWDRIQRSTMRAKDELGPRNSESMVFDSEAPHMRACALQNEISWRLSESYTNKVLYFSTAILYF
jgi:hypothetical protein